MYLLTSSTCTLLSCVSKGMQDDTPSLPKPRFSHIKKERDLLFEDTIRGPRPASTPLFVSHYHYLFSPQIPTECLLCATESLQDCQWGITQESSKGNEFCLSKCMEAS